MARLVTYAIGVLVALGGIASSAGAQDKDSIIGGDSCQNIVGGVFDPSATPSTCTVARLGIGPERHIYVAQNVNLVVTDRLGNAGTLTIGGKLQVHGRHMIAGYLAIESTGTFANYGNVIVAIGRIDNNGSILNSEVGGRIILQGDATLNNTGEFTNRPNASLEINGPNAVFNNRRHLRNDGTLRNAARLSNGQGGTVDNRGRIVNSGDLAVIANSADFQVRDGATVRNESGARFENFAAGQLRVFDGGLFRAVGGTVTNAGIVRNADRVQFRASAMFDNSGTFFNYCRSALQRRGAATITNPGVIWNVYSKVPNGLPGRVFPYVPSQCVTDMDGKMDSAFASMLPSS